jgi:uncharacterized protein YfaS (alpha-2-macroglobulin family)
VYTRELEHPKRRRFGVHRTPAERRNMTPPTNTYTVTFADAHAHTSQHPGVPGSGGNTMAGKADALLNCMQNEQISAALDLAAFTAGDTLTVTITQP